MLETRSHFGLMAAVAAIARAASPAGCEPAPVIRTFTTELTATTTSPALSETITTTTTKNAQRRPYARQTAHHRPSTDGDVAT